MGERVKNKFCVSDGITFASKEECNRYEYLKAQERAGEIQSLRRQVVYELIPAQYAESGQTYSRGAHAGEKKRGRLIERAVSYVADFVYVRDGKEVVEDVKGYTLTKDSRYQIFIIKRKLMLHIHGISVVEVKWNAKSKSWEELCRKQQSYPM